MKVHLISIPRLSGVDNLGLRSWVTMGSNIDPVEKGVSISQSRFLSPE